MRRQQFITCLLAAFLFYSCSKEEKDTVTPPEEDKITYESSTEIFPNPERGFIKTFIVKSGEPGLSAEQLNLLRGQNISLILRLFYFDGYKDKALDAAELDLIRADLEKIRTAGLKCILRFGYTDAIDGTDAPLNVVEGHIAQLKPLFEENKDVIAFVQAGFIGAWGEWHSSSNGLATPANQKIVLTKLLEALPEEIMVQVRTPLYKQSALDVTTPVSSDEAFTSAAKARVGHHNDCFLSSTNDYGTYNNIEAEKNYISKDALYVPTGGEACPPEGGFDPSCTVSRNEMKFLKWTYLNLDWYPGTIAAWKASGCFEEFQTYLGYRLALIEGSIPEKATTGQSVDVKLTLTNKGYAPLYHEKDVVLILKNSVSGELHEAPLNLDVRSVKPEAKVEIDQSVSLSGIPAGTYQLFVQISDKAASLKGKVSYSVRLGNKDVWTEENGGMNSLKTQLVIE